MSTTSEAYKTLGVDESSDLKTVKTAFRKLAMKHHPDRFQQASKDEQRAQSQKFQAVAAAYEIIKNQLDPAHKSSHSNLNKEGFETRDWVNEFDDQEFYNYIISLALKTKEGRAMRKNIAENLFDTEKYRSKGILNVKFCIASGVFTAATTFVKPFLDHASTLHQGFNAATFISITSGGIFALMGVNSKSKANNLESDYVRLEDNLYELGFDLYKKDLKTGDKPQSNNTTFELHQTS